MAKTAPRSMTTANKVTIFRILLVPAFVVQLLYYFRSGDDRDRVLALLIFAVAAILDGVDGYIARRYNQKSELGAILDPLADKFLLLSAICLLSINKDAWVPRFGEDGWIPTWLTAIVVSKDVILLLGMALVYYTCGKIRLTHRLIGKAATVLQIVVVLWTLQRWNPQGLWYLALATGIATAISGALYVRDGMKQLSQSPLSSPDHRL
jgi:CDP-diacylglycerol--glycerol-3-phosphate 3-phosphatidyltransferase